jgi:hypothetical protein
LDNISELNTKLDEVLSGQKSIDMRLRRIEENDDSKIDDAFIDVCKLV